VCNEGGSGGKRIHPAKDNKVNEDLDKRKDEEEDWEDAKTNPEAQTRSEGIPTTG
jgi:hypothetical protein